MFTDACRTEGGKVENINEINTTVRGRAYSYEDDLTVKELREKGFTYAEIAEQLGRTTKSVEKRVGRLRRGITSYTPRLKASSTPFTGSRKGDLTELEMSVYLFRKGWEVFRNLSSVGPIDLVIFNNETKQHYFIDAKTSNHSNSKNEKDKDVQIYTAVFTMKKISDYQSEKVIELKNTVNKKDKIIL